MTIAQISTLEDFIAELRAECARVADGIVRWEVSRTAKQEAEVDWEVTCWATTIIKADDERYLLEFGGTAGEDVTDEHQKGTEQADKWRMQLQAVCSDCGLHLRPGKIEVF